MALITNYEVYIFDKGGWSICSRYTSSQRETAINEAKELERQTNRPTKVVKERYDPKTNQGDEVVVYLSAKIMNGARSFSKGGSYRRDSGSDSWLDNTSYRKHSSAKKSLSYTGLFGRLFLLILASLGVAALISYLIVLLLNKIGEGLSSSTLYSITFAAFILIFVVTSIFSAILLIPWKDVDLLSPFSLNPSNTFAKSRYQKMTEYNPFESLFNFFRYLFTKREQRDPENKAEEITSEEVAAAEQEESGETESVTAKEILEEVKDKKASKAEEKEPEAKEEVRKVPPEKMKKIISIVDDFVKQVLSIVKRYDIRMDIYTRVSVNLVVAGACERISTFFNLPMKEYKEVLGLAIKAVSAETFVTDDNKTREFYEAFNNPTLESYHRELIVFGNRSMDTLLRKIKRDAFAGLGEHMQAWRDIVTAKVKPIEEELQMSRIITLMFTDISRSTEIAQNYGQEFMQKILHAHNSIVREALRLYRGNEVKHLGDGMFVRFDSAYDGLKAAIYIQDRIHAHNLAQPMEEFFVHIGMNAGEPISEDGDLFGTVVQVASRVCEQAKGGQILLTEDLYALAAGDGFIFNDEGDFTFKGLKDTFHLYSLVWQIGTQEPADESKERVEEEALASEETPAEQMESLEKDAEIVRDIKA